MKILIIIISLLLAGTCNAKTVTRVVSKIIPYGERVIATVTAYNTVPEQTDTTPCIAASGNNICGRRDVAACPRRIPIGTNISIDGAVYVCEDRLAMRYNNRFDISFDKDMEGALAWGRRMKNVIIIK